jgi:hypothetical protein
MRLINIIAPFKPVGHEQQWRYDIVTMVNGLPPLSELSAMIDGVFRLEGCTGKRKRPFLWFWRRNSWKVVYHFVRCKETLRIDPGMQKELEARK